MRADGQSPRYFALLYSSAPERAVLDALFGIEHEVMDSIRAGMDHNVAHSRLQWWREECERTAAGQPVHPLTRELVTSLGTAASASASARLARLSGLVDVVVWDLASATFETRREFAAYCERWASAMTEPLVLLSKDEGAGPTLSALGAAMREVELLADLAREAHRGRLRVPLDELESVHAEPSVVAKPPWPQPIAELLRSRHKTLRSEISRALGAISAEQQPALRGLIVWAALTLRLSQRVERALPTRFRAERFDGISDAWYSWRVARRATVGRFKLN
jgi:15-cis-phytoene synthase